MRNLIPHTHHPSEEEPEALTDPREVTEKVKSGEYFREARNAYAANYLNPMSERYFFLVYTTICVLIFLIILTAFVSLFPLRVSIPFLYESNDVLEELPSIKPLQANADEDPNAAIQRYLVSEYVSRREEFDIAKLDRNGRFIKAQSTPEVFSAWERQIDPANPDSPIAQFQRHSIRKIRIIGVAPNRDGTLDVEYEATVESGKEQKRTRMMATLAFQYAGVTIHPEEGGQPPVKFVVTDYRTRRLQE